MKGKRSGLPVAVNDELDGLVSEATRETGLSKTDVIRQGLRLGIPKVLESFKESARRRRPACLDYLEDYPLAAVTARDSETALRKKLRRHAPSYR